MIKLPPNTTTVRLRCGILATAWPAPAEAVVAPFVLQGITADGDLHSWQINGCWHEHSRPHPLDIIGQTKAQQDTSPKAYDGPVPPPCFES
jgi:hypothetical protein